MSDKLPTQVDEATTVFNDPPNILVLRRKAIRMFPHGQSVATYRNDNYNIDLAIPYTPATLGRKSVVATSEGINEAMSAELKKIRKERGMFKRDLSRQEDRFETSKQRLDWAKRALAGHIKKHGKSLDAIGEAIQYVAESTEIDESTADAMFGSYLHNQNKGVEQEVSNRYGHKALHHFLRAAVHYIEGSHETANHHYQAFKRSVSEEIIDENDNIKHHQKSFSVGDDATVHAPAMPNSHGKRVHITAVHHEDNGYLYKAHDKKTKKHMGWFNGHELVKEEIIDELSRQTLGSYIKSASKDAADNIDKANHYTAKPIKYHRDRAKKRLTGIEHATSSLTKEELDDTIMEATIHSLHTITKTQHPAKIRFRDGSSAMVDHPTAAQIMKLHSKVNRLNKKKLEGLINSGPMGIRKVSSFIKDHMK